MRDFLAFLSGFVVIGAIWGLLVLLKRSRHGLSRPRVEPVDSSVPRARQEPVKEIDAEWRTDYLPRGRKGEPFFSPGGGAALAGAVGMIVLAAALGFIFEPVRVAAYRFLQSLH